jgi:hypothetical protein
LARVHKALLRSKLNPYLGFSAFGTTWKTQFSMYAHLSRAICYLIDDFLIERYQKLRKKDFVLITDFIMHLKMGKKIHLKEYETDSLANDLNAFFDHMINVERIKVGNWQTIDTLISEEALLFAKYLRHETKEGTPRLPAIKI